jgi:hypothetical protein
MDIYRTIRFLEGRKLFFTRKQVLKTSDSEQQAIAESEISNLRFEIARTARRGL